MEVVEKLLDEELEEDDDDEEALDSTILDEIDTIEESVNEINNRKEAVELVSADEPKKKKRKKSEKCKVCGEKGHRKMDCERLPEDRRKELQELFNMKVERKGKGTGRKKNKKNPDILPYEDTEDRVEKLADNEELKVSKP